MSTTIVYKTYEDIQIKAIAFIFSFKYVNLNKFTLQMFNKLTYK